MESKRAFRGILKGSASEQGWRLQREGISFQAEFSLTASTGILCFVGSGLRGMLASKRFAGVWG